MHTEFWKGAIELNKHTSVFSAVAVWPIAPFNPPTKNKIKNIQNSTINAHTHTHSHKDKPNTKERIVYAGNKRSYTIALIE